MNSSTAPVLLLLTDHRLVLEHAVWLDGEVVRVPTVGGARRWLREQQEMAWPELVGMVAWGPDVLRRAEEHWRLDGEEWAQLRGVPQVALRVPQAPSLTTAGVVAALGGREVRIVPFPAAIESLNEEVWGPATDLEAA